jgi:hypothetical protein
MLSRLSKNCVTNKLLVMSGSNETCFYAGIGAAKEASSSAHVRCHLVYVEASRSVGGCGSAVHTRYVVGRGAW